MVEDEDVLGMKDGMGWAGFYNGVRPAAPSPHTVMFGSCTYLYQPAWSV